MNNPHILGFKKKKTMIQNQNIMPKELQSNREAHFPGQNNTPREPFSSQFKKMDINRRNVAARRGETVSISQKKQFSPPNVLNSMEEFRRQSFRRGKARSSVRVEVGPDIHCLDFKSQYENNSRISFRSGRFENTPNGQHTMGLEFNRARLSDNMLRASFNAFEHYQDSSTGFRAHREQFHFKSPILRKRAFISFPQNNIPKYEHPTVKKVSTSNQSNENHYHSNRNDNAPKTITQLRSFRNSVQTQDLSGISNYQIRERNCSFKDGVIRSRILPNRPSTKQSDYKLMTQTILRNPPQKEFFKPELCNVKENIQNNSQKINRNGQTDLIQFQNEAANFPFKNLQKENNGFRSLGNPIYSQNNRESPSELFQKIEKTSNDNHEKIDELKPISGKRDMKNQVAQLNLKNDFGEYILAKFPDFIKSQEFQNSEEEVLVLAIRKSREELEPELMYDHLKEDKPIRIEARKSKKTRLIDRYDEYVAILAQESVNYRTRHPSLERMVFYTKNEMFKIKSGNFIGQVKSLELTIENFEQCKQILEKVLRTFEEETDLLDSDSETSKPDLNDNRKEEEKEEKIGIFKIQKSYQGDSAYANLIDQKNDIVRKKEAPKLRNPDIAKCISSIAIKSLIQELLSNKILTATSSINFIALRRLALNNRLSQPLSISFFLLTLSQFIDPPLFNLAYRLVLRIFQKCFSVYLESARIIFVEGKITLKWGESIPQLDRISFKAIVSECLKKNLEELGKSGEESRFEFMSLIKNISFSQLIEDFVFLFEEITAA